MRRKNLIVMLVAVAAASVLVYGSALADKRGPVPDVPASIAGNGSWVSGCLAGGDFRAFDVFVAVGGAATVQIQRYVDPQCNYAAGDAVPTTPLALSSGGVCTGGTFCGDVGNNDGMPFSSLKITITDTSGSTNAVSVVYMAQGGQ